MASAYEIKNQEFSLICSEDIENRILVKVDSSGEAAICGNGETPVGVSTEDGDDGDAIDVADGIVICTAGEAVAAGSAVQCGASGKVIVLDAYTEALSGDAETLTIDPSAKIGIALTAAAAANELITIKLQ